MSIKTLFSEYFGKDKGLRHYGQHFLMATFTLFVAYLFFREDFTFSTVLLLYIGTFFIDLVDFTITLLLFYKRFPLYWENVSKYLKVFDLKKSAEMASKYHTTIDRLLLHNLVGAALFILTILIFFENVSLRFLILGILNHMLLDILFDIRFLNGIHHWLWPFAVLFPNSKN